MKTYFSLLDVVRFFAAFWVMNFHYFLSYTGETSWHRYGNLGVQLFFIVSGFVITQSLQGKDLKTFALGRFIRLFPLFWIVCTLTYILTLLIPNSNPVSFTEYLISMTMLGDKFGASLGFARLVDPVYWTLAVELIFYFGVGIFAYLFSEKNLRYFFGIWLVITFFSYFLKIDQNFLVKLLLVRHAAYFIFGGTLALIATQQAKNIYHKYYDRILLLVSAIFATYIHPQSLPPYFGPIPADTFIISILHGVFFIGIALLVYLSSYITNQRIVRVFAIIGGLTYPLYLIHQTAGEAIIKYITNKYTIPWNNFAIVMEVIAIGIAYIIYVQDKKLRGWLRGKLLIKD